MEAPFDRLLLDADNRARARARDKPEGGQFCWKQNMKILLGAVRK